nr:reverse transcriptase domain-containing protein [Tanacetum cinerariifolium]
PRHSEAFCRWCAAPLSTFYPPTTSESSSGDLPERPLHSSSHSAIPSRKRCRSPNDFIPSSTPVTVSLAPTRVDLLPPRKRDHIKVDPRDDRVEFEASVGDTVAFGIDPRSVPRVDEEIVEPAEGDSSSSSDTRDGIVRSVEDMPVNLDGAICDFYHHMSEVHVNRIVGIETTQRQLQADQMIASRARAGMAESIRSLRSENLKIRNDRDDLRRKLRRLESFAERRLRFCVVGLIRWCEKMETMFHISNCPERYQVKYATCTLLDSALTWWNSHKRTIRIDAAYALSRRELMKLMTEVYCPRNEIQKMETELWNLSVKNDDMATYTQRFQELTMMCTKMVPEEEDRVEKFIGGLPDNIQENVIAAEPTRLQDAIRIANNLMDKKLKGYVVKNAENKRRFDTNHRDNYGKQPPFKRQNTRGQNVARAYTAGNNEKRDYEGTLPYFNRCKLHHEGQCTVRCHNCRGIRHLARDCRSVMAIITQGTPG